MQKNSYQVTKDERLNFYEFIERQYTKVELKVNQHDMEIKGLRRDVNNLLREGYMPFDEDTLYDNSMYSLKSYSAYEKRMRVFDIQIANRIYKPLAASTSIASAILAISVGIVTATPILAVPFIASTLFSAYFWYLQDRKGKS
jgi:hypothetical protein